MGLVDFNLSDIGELFKDLREAITGKKIEDPEKRAELELKLAKLEHALKIGQIEINKEEAKSKFLFVAGWRPFIGWVCGFSLLYNFVIYPLLVGIFSVYHINYQLPTLDFGVLFNLLVAMLGMATLRTYEKTKNVQNKH